MFVQCSFHYLASEGGGGGDGQFPHLSFPALFLFLYVFVYFYLSGRSHILVILRFPYKMLKHIYLMGVKGVPGASDRCAELPQSHPQPRWHPDHLHCCFSPFADQQVFLFLLFLWFCLLDLLLGGKKDSFLLFLRVFHADLQSRLQQWRADQCVGDVFVKLGFKLKVYTNYLNNYTTILHTIDKVRMMICIFCTIA